MKIFRSKAERRRDDFAGRVGEFANSNPKYKDSLIIIADPDTNVVVGAYRGLISGFHNKSSTRTIRDLFKYNPNEDQRIGIQSERNKSIYQFLFEIDGILDGFAKKLYNLSIGKKDLAYLEKKGMIRVGSQKVDEKGNVKELAVVR